MTDQPPNPSHQVLAEFVGTWRTAAACSKINEALPALRLAAQTGRSTRDALGERGAPWPLIAQMNSTIEAIDEEIRGVQIRLDLCAELDRLAEEFDGDLVDPHA